MKLTGSVMDHQSEEWMGLREKAYEFKIIKSSPSLEFQHVHHGASRSRKKSRPHKPVSIPSSFIELTSSH